ncbi:MAG: TIGR02266 family protein [Deltaproteobacteria bacterium]|nr:MAG: TIGR02266 family protein [Deltaproteobacteria bacterium]
MSPPEDLRQSQRAPVRLRIDYERMNAFFADYTRNISKGGTFIKTSRPLEVGSRCQFSLSLPALPVPLVLDGEVIWILAAEEAQQSGAEPGMGIRFVFADEAGRREFERAIERIMEESLGADVVRRLLRR